MEENKKNKNPNVPNLGFKNDGEWEEITIHKLSKIVTKQTGLDYTNIIKHSLVNYKGIDLLPYIQTKNFHCRNINYETDYYIPREIASKYPKIILNENCILLSIVGASVGNIGFFNNLETSFLSGAICVVKAKQESDLEDIYHYMLSPYGQRQIKTCTKGAAQATITIDDIRNFVIKRSKNVLVRNKINSFVKAIDFRIEVQNKIIKEYESLINSILEAVLKNSNYSCLCLKDVAVVKKGEQVNNSLLSDDALYPMLNGGLSFSGYYTRFNKEKRTRFEGRG